VSCAAALAVLDTIHDDGLLDQVKRVGAHLGDALGRLSSPLVRGTRGIGLWRAVQLAGNEAPAVETAARERGLLVNAVKPDALRLAPPLILTEADVDAAVPLLQAALEAVAS
jgi:acetylornithine aminotransferase